MKSRLAMAVLVLVASLIVPPVVVSAEAQAAAAAKPATSAPGAELKKVLAPIVPQDGDCFVFLGDSITHQCLYTQYIEDYCFTRYPKARIRFHNSGVGGDRAADALARFDADVAAYKPRYVTILLGMNDGGVRDFDKELFDIYQKHMTELLDRLDKIGTIAVLMTPTMFDSRAALLLGKPLEPRLTYYNGVLALYGAWLREVAQARGLGFVDMYGPLNRITLAERRKDAAFTLIRDSVHPEAPGQLIMAAAMIEDLFARSSVSSIVVQSKSGKLTATATGGTIQDFQAEGDVIRFTFTANALPWVVPPEAALGYQLAAAGHRYSNESFAARNLAPGKYELKIDGQPVGVWTDGQLAFRVELQANDKTPQYQQALRVALLNKERNDKAVRPLRDLWRQLKNRQRQLAAGPDKKEAFEQWLAEEFKPGVAKLEALAKDFEEQIYRINQPLSRKYELVRVP